MKMTTVLMMDNDVRALRSVDHLQLSPAPAFHFFVEQDMVANPRKFGVNSGVALIDVRHQAELDEAWELYHWLQRHQQWDSGRLTKLLWDGSDQTFWNAYVWNRTAAHRPVFELSRRYNLFKFEDLAEGDCHTIRRDVPPPTPCASLGSRWIHDVVFWHKLDGGGAQKMWKLPPQGRAILANWSRLISQAGSRKG